MDTARLHDFAHSRRWMCNPLKEMSLCTYLVDPVSRRTDHLLKLVCHLFKIPKRLSYTFLYEYENSIMQLVHDVTCDSHMGYPLLRLYIR